MAILRICRFRCGSQALPLLLRPFPQPLPTLLLFLLPFWAPPPPPRRRTCGTPSSPYICIMHNKTPMKQARCDHTSASRSFPLRAHLHEAPLMLALRALATKKNVRRSMTAPADSEAQAQDIAFALVIPIHTHASAISVYPARTPSASRVQINLGSILRHTKRTRNKSPQNAPRTERTLCVIVSTRECSRDVYSTADEENVSSYLPW